MSKINLAMVMAFGTKIESGLYDYDQIRWTRYIYKNKRYLIATPTRHGHSARHDQNTAPEHIKRHKHLIRIKSDKCAPAKRWLKSFTTRIVEIAGQKHEICFKKEHIDHHDITYGALGHSQYAFRHLDRFRKSAATT